MFDTWFRTVLGLRKSCLAIAGLLWPSAMRVEDLTLAVGELGEEVADRPGPGVRRRTR